MPPSLVIFDLGRVLVRIVDGWAHACTQAGLCPTPTCDQAPVQQRMLTLSQRHEMGQLDDETFCRQMADLTGHAPDEVRAVASAWLCGTFPGTAELVEELHARGVAMACLSNTNALHWRIMHGPGHNAIPFHRFAHRFASHLIGTMKPDAAIYEHVECATALPPAALIFFDDSPPNVEMARARGWQAFPILPTEPPAPQMRRHLADLRVL